MFIPSYARSNKDPLVTRWQEWSKEIPIVFVVRRYEFNAYYKKLNSTCSIFWLPDDTQWGIGYARYIIVKMMKAWGVNYGIMCGDSMYSCGELRENESGTTDLRKMDLKEMLAAICNLYKEKWFAENVACISPAVYNPRHSHSPKCPARSKSSPKWKCKAPTVCQVLNVQVIANKDINFRPELRVNMEDLVFGLECYEKGVKCLTWHKVALREASNTGEGCSQNEKIGSPKRESAP